MCTQTVKSGDADPDHVRLVGRLTRLDVGGLIVCGVRLYVKAFVSMGDPMRVIVSAPMDVLWGKHGHRQQRRNSGEEDDDSRERAGQHGRIMTSQAAGGQTRPAATTQQYVGRTSAAGGQYCTGRRVRAQRFHSNAMARCCRAG